MSEDTDPHPTGDEWVCVADHDAYGYCTGPVGAIPGHNGCGEAPSPRPAPGSPVPEAGRPDTTHGRTMADDLPADSPLAAWVLAAADALDQLAAAPAPSAAPPGDEGSVIYELVDDFMTVKFHDAAAPVSPGDGGRREELDALWDLPEFVALVEAVDDDGGTVANYRATTTGKAAALVRSVRAASREISTE